MPGLSLELLRGLLEALQCGAAVIDREGVMVHVNPRLAAMVQRPRSALAGLPLAELCEDRASRARLADLLARFDEPAQGECRLVRPDGLQVPVLLASRPVRSRGKSNGRSTRHHLTTFVDISPQKRILNDIAALGDTVIEQAVELKRLNATLEQRVEQRTAELNTANMEAIRMLAVASEARDTDTGSHVQRIEAGARRLAMAVGRPDDEAVRIGHAAVLHDVGKIHLPDHILKKPGRLTDEERHVMQRHTLIGERILSTQPFFETARVIARSHHENWDGSGYPDGLRGQAIPLAARIVHLVDVYDALVSDRPYKRAWTTAAAQEEIRRNAGRMFDPELAEAFTGSRAAQMLKDEQ